MQTSGSARSATEEMKRKVMTLRNILLVSAASALVVAGCSNSDSDGPVAAAPADQVADADMGGGDGDMGGDGMDDGGTDGDDMGGDEEMPPADAMAFLNMEEVSASLVNSAINKAVDDGLGYPGRQPSALSSRFDPNGTYMLYDPDGKKLPNGQFTGGTLSPIAGGFDRVVTSADGSIVRRVIDFNDRDLTDYRIIVYKIPRDGGRHFYQTKLGKLMPILQDMSGNGYGPYLNVDGRRWYLRELPEAEKPNSSNSVTAYPSNIAWGEWLYTEPGGDSMDAGDTLVVGSTWLHGTAEMYPQNAMEKLAGGYTYKGDARGVVSSGGSEPSKFSGAMVNLTANFGDNPTIHKDYALWSIGGDVKGIKIGADQTMRLKLDRAALMAPSMANGMLHFRGRVDSGLDEYWTDPWTDPWTGTWGGNFYGTGTDYTGTSNIVPTMAAGSFGATNGDMSILGSFGADYTKRLLSSDK